MIKHLPKNLFGYLAFAIVNILIVLGSLGIFRELILLLGIAIGMVLLGLKFIVEKQVNTDRETLIYVFFIIVLAIHTFITKGDYYYFGVYFSGLIFIHLAKNFKDVFSRHFYNLLVVLGLLMGVMYIFSYYIPIDLPNLSTLFAPATNTIKHSNIGDIWSVIVVASIFGLRRGLHIQNISVVAIGLIFVAISFSRSAVLAVAVGILYLFYKSEAKIFKKYFPYVFVALSVVFLVFGSYKSILFSRPYFWESIKGLWSYPFGTGLGKFALVSESTNLAHSVVLEIVSALGIFSIPFVVWIIKVYKNTLAVDQENFFIKSVQLAIMIILMFTPNYIVLGFMWLWFLSIGLEDKDNYSPR